MKVWSQNRWLRVAAMVAICAGSAGRSAHAQASAIPSAGPAPTVSGNGPALKGRKLIEQMVAALGGDAWLNRGQWSSAGKIASFYKGQPTEGVFGYEAYERAQPFGERIVIISRFGVFIPSDHRDVAEVWTAEGGYEVTFRGKKALPKLEVDDFELRRKHTIDVVVKEWLKQPGVLVSYEGTSMVARHLSDRVSVLTANNDAVTLELDASTHLPLSRTFQYRDPQFKDTDTDVEQYDGYHAAQGIMTPYTVTRLKNGDMVSQRFLTKMTYESALSPDLFDPDKSLMKKPSGK